MDGSLKVRVEMRDAFFGNSFGNGFSAREKDGADSTGRARKMKASGCALKFDPRCDLAGACAAEVRSNARRNQSEAARTEIHVGIAEVGVVEHVGKGPFKTHMEPFGDGKTFAEACGEVDEAGAFDRAYLAVAEASDRQRNRAQGGAGGGSQFGAGG